MTTNDHGRSDSSTATDRDDSTTRRQLLRGAAVGAGGLLFGLGTMGSATATGKGGKAAVSLENFESDRPFYFDKATGNLDRKTCDKGGNGIVLAEWLFHYEGEDPKAHKIYTRDNAIDTDVRYALADAGTVDCGEFVLTTYSPAGSP